MSTATPGGSRPAPASCVYIDALSFSWPHFAGISRYTARLSLALGARMPVRFFHDGQEFLTPRLGWSQDQDLEEWGRRVWDSPRRPLGAPPESSIGLYSRSDRAGGPSRTRRASCTTSARWSCPGRSPTARGMSMSSSSPRTSSPPTSRWRTRTRRRPTPAGSRRWSPIGSSWPTPGRASASRATAIAGGSSGPTGSAWWSRRSSRGRTPRSSSTGSTRPPCCRPTPNSGGWGSWAG